MGASVVLEVDERPAHDEGHGQLVEGVEEEAGEAVGVVDGVGPLQARVQQRYPQAEEEGLLPRAHPPVVPDTHRWVIDRWVTDRWASSHVPTRQWFLTHTGGL